MSLFGAKRIWWIDGMNLLTDMHLISDLCVDVSEVPLCDTLPILVRAGAWWCDAEMYRAKRLSVKQQTQHT